MTMVSARPWRFNAFFRNFKAADLSRFLVTNDSRISPSWSTARHDLADRIRGVAEHPRRLAGDAHLRDGVVPVVGEGRGRRAGLVAGELAVVS